MPLVIEGWDDGGQRVPSVSDADLKACCAVVAESRDGMQDPQSDAWLDRGNCCTLLDWTGSVTCTPWGPPVPPAFA